jgi:hypothetical protein
MAGGGGRWRAAGTSKREEGGFYRPGHVRKGGSTTTNGHRGHNMGGKAVGDVRKAGGQWRKAVRAPACGRQPRGTGLGGGHASPTLGA